MLLRDVADSERPLVNQMEMHPFSANQLRRFYESETSFAPVIWLLVHHTDQLGTHSRASQRFGCRLLARLPGNYRYLLDGVLELGQPTRESAREEHVVMSTKSNTRWIICGRLRIFYLSL